MDNYKEKQGEIFRSPENDSRLTGSAKRQIKLFLSLLQQEPDLGFDTTSALLYGFLRNEEFVDPGVCPLNDRQLKKALEISRYEATRDTAHEATLLTRVSRLPLDKILGKWIDLKDLAVSFLTTHQMFRISLILTKEIKNYMNILISQRNFI